MASQSSHNGTKEKRTRSHKWTNFEGSVLMALIVRNVHKTGLDNEELAMLSESTALRQQHRNTPRKRQRVVKDTSCTLKYVDVATALNRALNRSDYSKDIPVEEVRRLLDYFLEDRKGAIAVIERQPIGRLTRSSKKIWHRGLNFLGTKDEWEDGRKAEEEVKRQQDQEKRRNAGTIGSIATDANGIGVADGWGNNNAVANDGWGVEANGAEKENPVHENSGAWGDAMEVDPPVSKQNNAWATDQASPMMNLPSGPIQTETRLRSSNATDSSTAAMSYQADSWGASVEGTVELNSTMASWGEVKSSENAVTSNAVASEWSTTDDPFATPLPPRPKFGQTAAIHSTANRLTTLTTTTISQTPGAPNSTTIATEVCNDPWNEAATNHSNEVSYATENSWGAINDTPMLDMPFSSTVGFGESSTTPYQSIANIAADPWDTIATPFVAAPSAADWGIETSSMALTNTPLTEVEQPATCDYHPSTTKINTQVEACGDPWSAPLSDNSQFSRHSNHWATSGSNTQEQSQNQWAIDSASISASEGVTLRGWEDTPVDNTSNVSSWDTAAEQIPQPRGIESAFRSQIIDVQGNAFEKVVQVVGPRINPERLAMLAAADAGEPNGGEEQSSSEFNANAEPNISKKGFEDKAAFRSKDNAIPLPFNRLTGERRQTE